MQDLREAKETERSGYPIELLESMPDIQIEQVESIEEYSIEIYEALYLLFIKFCEQKNIDLEEGIEAAMIEFMNNHQ